MPTLGDIPKVGIELATIRLPFGDLTNLAKPPFLKSALTVCDRFLKTGKFGYLVIFFLEKQESIDSIYIINKLFIYCSYKILTAMNKSFFDCSI